MIFGGNVSDYICNKTIYATCGVYAHSASLLQVLKWGWMFFHFNDATIETSRITQALW